MEAGMASNSKFNISIEIGIANKQNKQTVKTFTQKQSCHKLCSVVCHFFCCCIYFSCESSFCCWWNQSQYWKMEMWLPSLVPCTHRENIHISDDRKWRARVCSVHCFLPAGAFKVKYCAGLEFLCGDYISFYRWVSVGLYISNLYPSLQFVWVKLAFDTAVFQCVLFTLSISV